MRNIGAGAIGFLFVLAMLVIYFTVGGGLP